MIGPEPATLESLALLVIELQGRTCELIEEVARLTAALAGAHDPEGHLPAQCRQHACGYYTHYLAYGPADLTHEGYHAAEKLAIEHLSNCHWELGVGIAPCRTCLDWERRVRA